MTSKLVWTGIVTGVAGAATAVYLAREQIVAFAVKTASKAAVKAAVKAPITIANQAAQATVGKATETAKDTGKLVSGVTTKLPGKLKVGH
jgi:hypothetical protein